MVDWVSRYVAQEAQHCRDSRAVGSRWKRMFQAADSDASNRRNRLIHCCFSPACDAEVLKVEIITVCWHHVLRRVERDTLSTVRRFTLPTTLITTPLPSSTPTHITYTYNELLTTTFNS
jgi:hypothetical protein